MFGEITLELGGVTLPLEFKSKNLRTLKKITGKGTIELFKPFLRAQEGDTFDVVAERCDLDLLVDLIVAGLARHPKYKTQTHESLRDKICDLIDDEAEKRGKGVLILAMELTMEVLPEAVKSLHVEGSEDAKAEESGDPKNDDAELGA